MSEAVTVFEVVVTPWLTVVESTTAPFPSLISKRYTSESGTLVVEFVKTSTTDVLSVIFAPLAGETSSGAVALSVEPSGPVIEAPVALPADGAVGADDCPHATMNATRTANPLSINLCRDMHLSRRSVSCGNEPWNIRSDNGSPGHP